MTKLMKLPKFPSGKPMLQTGARSSGGNGDVNVNSRPNAGGQFRIAKPEELRAGMLAVGTRLIQNFPRK